MIKHPAIQSLNCRWEGSWYRPGSFLFLSECLLPSLQLELLAPAFIGSDKRYDHRRTLGTVCCYHHLDIFIHFANRLVDRQKGVVVDV